MRRTYPCDPLIIQLSARNVYRKRLKPQTKRYRTATVHSQRGSKFDPPNITRVFPFDVSFDPQDYRIWISILPWLAAAKLLRGRVASGGGCAKDEKLGPGSGSDNCLESDPFGSNQLGAMITEEEYCFLP